MTSRLRERRQSEEGLTLAEVLVTVTILGLCIAGIVSGLGTASLASDYHRKGVDADTVVRDYAEAVKQRVRLGAYQECASPSDYSPKNVGYNVPTGFSAGVSENGMQYQASASLNVILIIDRSGSMFGSRATVVQAANAFLDDLSKTAARVAIISFNDDATIEARPQPVSSNLTTLKSKVSGLIFPISAGTNWDAALGKAVDVVQGNGGSPFPTGTAPPHVVLITDGDPTYYVNADGSRGGDGRTTTSREVTEAVNVANDLKNYFSVHMFALGVQGNGGLNVGNLQAVSGVKKFGSGASDEKDFAKADWMDVSSVSLLQSALLSIADDLDQQSFSGTCPQPDQGVQRIMVEAASDDGRAREILEIIVRQP